MSPHTKAFRAPRVRGNVRRGTRDRRGDRCCPKVSRAGVSRCLPKERPAIIHLRVGLSGGARDHPPSSTVSCRFFWRTQLTKSELRYRAPNESEYSSKTRRAAGSAQIAVWCGGVQPTQASRALQRTRAGEMANGQRDKRKAGLPPGCLLELPSPANDV